MLDNEYNKYSKFCNCIILNGSLNIKSCTDILIIMIVNVLR